MDAFSPPRQRVNCVIVPGGPGNRMSPRAVIRGGVLTFTAVDATDEGEYTCKALNTHGEHTARVSLIVQSMCLQRSMSGCENIKSFSHTVGGKQPFQKKRFGWALQLFILLLFQGLIFLTTEKFTCACYIKGNVHPWLRFLPLTAHRHAEGGSGEIF